MLGHAFYVLDLTGCSVAWAWRRGGQTMWPTMRRHSLIVEVDFTDLDSARPCRAAHGLGLAPPGGDMTTSVAPNVGVAKVMEKKLPKYPMPVALIGRLAIDRRAQGRRLGDRLLMDVPSHRPAGCPVMPGPSPKPSASTSPSADGHSPSGRSCRHRSRVAARRDMIPLGECTTGL